MAPADQLEGVRELSQLACGMRRIGFLVVGLALAASCVPTTPLATATGAEAFTTVESKVTPPLGDPSGSSSPITAENAQPLTSTPSPGATATPRRIAPEEFARALQPEYKACGAVSPSGDLLALQDFATDEIQTPPTVVLWSSKDWSPLWTATGSELRASLQFSPDEAHLASGIRAGGKIAHVIVSTRNTMNGAYERAIDDFYHAVDLSYSPDGDTLAIANFYVYLYRLEDVPRYMNEGSQPRRTEPSQVLKLADPDNLIGASQFSPSSDLIALASVHGDLLFWKPGDSVPTYRSAPATRCPPDRQRDLPRRAFSRDGELLAAALCTNSVALVEVKNPNLHE